MIPKERCELQLASEAVGNSDRLFVDRTCGCVNHDVVQFKEQQCSDGPRSLVTVDKGMILHDMEQVRCGHVKRKFMQITATECACG